MKKTYIQPKITVVSVHVENGYQCSVPTMNGMTEAIDDYCYQEIGNSEPWYPHGTPTLEGINQGIISGF